MNNSNKTVDRFKRAIRYRKWAILLFSFIGPLGVIAEGALNSHSPSVMSVTNFYFFMVVMVISYFMAKDEYKELSD